MNTSTKLLGLAVLSAGILFSAPSFGGDSPDARRRVLCEDTGRTVGEQAYQKWEAARGHAYSHGNAGDASSDLQEKWAKYDYLNRIEQTYGKGWIVISEDIFTESRNASNVQTAREIGFSVCMASELVPDVSPSPVKRGLRNKGSTLELQYWSSRKFG